MIENIKNKPRTETLDESFDRLYGTSYAKEKEVITEREVKVPKFLRIIVKVLTFFVAFFITGPNPGGYSFYTTNAAGKITALNHVRGGQNHIHCHIAGFLILALNVFIIWEIAYNGFEFPIMKDILPGVFVIISLIQIVRAIHLLNAVYPPEVMYGSQIGITSNTAKGSSYRKENNHSSNSAYGTSSKHENISEFNSYVNMKMSVMSNSQKADYMNYINGGSKNK
jgi:hypothetical protein